MTRASGKTLSLALAACVIAFVASSPAWAGMIDINLTGFRVDYSTDDNQLHDRKDDAGGNLDPNEAVALTGTEFQFNDSLVTQYSKSMGQQTYADMLVKDITPTLTLPTSGSPASISTGDNLGTFGFDWFYDDGGTTRSLQLLLDKVTVGLIYNGNSTRPTLVVTGSTSNWMQTKLPGGLAFDTGTDISFSYTTSNTMTLSGDEGLTDLLAMGGVMQISGDGEIIVPEPPTGTLVLSALCILVIVTHSHSAKPLQDRMRSFLGNGKQPALCPSSVTRREFPRQDEAGQDGTNSHVLS